MSAAARQAAKLGLFVVLVAGVLLLALALMGGLSFWRPVDEYYVITEEGVAGLEVNSTVMLRGVAVGQVEAITLDPDSFAEVHVELAIDPEVAIPVGTKAYIERVGLTGQRAINLRGGELEAGRLPPGSVIPRGETQLDRLERQSLALGDELSELVSELGEAAQRVDRLVAAVDPDRVEAVVAAVDPARVEAIVAHTERATRSLAATGRQLDRAVREARTHMRTITADVDATSERVREQVDALADQAVAVLEQAEQAAAELDAMIDDADAIVDANAGDLRRTVKLLRSTAWEARTLITEIRAQPSLLLRSKKRR